MIIDHHYDSFTDVSSIQIESMNLVRNPCTPEGLNTLLKYVNVDQITVGYNHVKVNRYEDFMWDVSYASF